MDLSHKVIKVWVINCDEKIYIAYTPRRTLAYITGYIESSMEIGPNKEFRKTFTKEIKKAITSSRFITIPFKTLAGLNHLNGQISITVLELDKLDEIHKLLTESYNYLCGKSIDKNDLTERIDRMFTDSTLPE